MKSANKKQIKHLIGLNLKLFDMYFIKVTTNISKCNLFIYNALSGFLFSSC